MTDLLKALLLLFALFVCLSASDQDGDKEAAPFGNSDGILPMLFRGIGGTIGRISQYNWANLWNNQTANMIMRDDVVQSKCYGELGCVTYTDEWYHSVYRPVNFFPLERHLVAVRFWVHTRAHPRQNMTLSAGDSASVERSGFDAQKDTKFIIHGFLDTGTDDWVQEMVQRLLDTGDFNVIAVDWRFGAMPMYQQAVSNTQLVAMETVHLIKWLQTNYGLNVTRVHVIGHSLGAQTAGYVGARVPGLGRITGLDPAEPGFQYMAATVRLDPGDASFVDVIHSDARSFITTGLGMIQPCGHLDFFPNGGKDQPGCSSYTNTLAVLLESSVDDFEAELFACRHIRAVRVFTDSIGFNDACAFVGHECESYDRFLKGECASCGANNEHCASMGYHADKYPFKTKTNVPFYLTTAAKAPYCLRHYRASLVLADPDKKKATVKGHLMLSLYGPRGKLERYRLPKKETATLRHGQSYSFLVRTATDLGPVHRVQVSWHEERGSLLSLPCLLWCPDRSLVLAEITVLDMDAPGSSEATVQRFCAADNTASVRIRPGGGKATLYNRSKCPGSDDGGTSPQAAVASPAGATTGRPSNPIAGLSGRNQRLRLDERTTDGGGPRRMRPQTSQPQRNTNWLWRLFNLLQ